MILRNVIILAGGVSAGGGRSYKRAKTDERSSGDVEIRDWNVTATVASVRETSILARMRNKITRRLAVIAPEVGGIAYCRVENAAKLRATIARAESAARRWRSVARHTYLRVEYVMATVPPAECSQASALVSLEITELLAGIIASVDDPVKLRSGARDCERIASILASDSLAAVAPIARARAGEIKAGASEYAATLRNVCESLQREYSSYAGLLRTTVDDRAERVEALTLTVAPAAPAPAVPAPVAPAPAAPAPVAPAPAPAPAPETDFAKLFEALLR